MSEQAKGYLKSLPEITPYTKPFWDAAKAHELKLQRCSKCGDYQFYPRPSCIHCSERELEWSTATGRGTVYSFTIIRQVVANSPAFQEEIPFVVAEIQLSEGPRIFSNLVGVKPEEVKIGMQVQVTFDDVTSEISLPRFRPA